MIAVASLLAATTLAAFLQSSGDGESDRGTSSSTASRDNTEGPAALPDGYRPVDEEGEGLSTAVPRNWERVGIVWEGTGDDEVTYTSPDKATKLRLFKVSDSYPDRPFEDVHARADLEKLTGPTSFKAGRISGDRLEYWTSSPEADLYIVDSRFMAHGTRYAVVVEYSNENLADHEVVDVALQHFCAAGAPCMD